MGVTSFSGRTSSAPRLFARALRPFTRVLPAEVATVSTMTFVGFVLMSGYYLLKIAREPLILIEWGAEAKLYVEAGQAVILLGVLRAYSAIARRVARLKLIATVYLFFVSNMIAFAIAARAGMHVGLAFFLWVGLFSYTSIAQFWAFAADIYTEEQGTRLFALIGTGSAIGSVAGSALARAMIPLGPVALMTAAAFLVAGCVPILAWVDWRARAAGQRPGRTRDSAPEAAEPVASETLREVLYHNRYLALIAALTITLNCVSGLGDYVLDRTLLARLALLHRSGAAAEAFVGSFKASLFAWYNLLAVLLQLFAVSRILTRFGVRSALLLLPTVAFLGYGAFAVVPWLALIRLVVISNRALDYSLTNTARHVLFLIASRAEKYVGKTFVDTVGARAGDLVSAMVVWFGVRAGVRLTGIAMVCACVACAWIAVVLGIGREHARRLALMQPPVSRA